MNLADRIAVLFEGRIVGIVDAGSTTVEELGVMMAGTPSCRHRALRPDATREVNTAWTRLTATRDSRQWIRP